MQQFLLKQKREKNGEIARGRIRQFKWLKRFGGVSTLLTKASGLSTLKFVVCMKAEQFKAVL